MANNYPPRPYNEPSIHNEAKPTDARMKSWEFLKAVLLWPFGRRPRHVLTVLAAALVTWNLVFQCLREGVDGHVSCDFAGQWMHGRAFFRQECDQLYQVDAGKRWLAEGYTGDHLDQMIADILRKGQAKEPADGVEGPLYPPTAALLFSVLAPFDPRTSHVIAICLYLLLAHLSGWLISLITRGRLQYGEAALLILLFPNNFMGLILGQNHQVTLFILTLGWFCLSRRLPFVAGLVWALLAYKPVFAVALILVPIALPSRRMFLGMSLGGLFFTLSTLLFTGTITPTGLDLRRGIEPWLRWVEVGQRAEEIYRIDRNWVWMSRDLVGLPRRKMWDPQSAVDAWRYHFGVWDPGATWYVPDADGHLYWDPAVWLFVCDPWEWQKHQQVYYDEVEVDGVKKRVPWELSTVLGWCLLGFVAVGTVTLGWMTRQQGMDSDPSTGPRAIFLLTGGLLSVLHFMHYDLTSFALPVLLLIVEVATWRRTRLIAALVWLALWALCSVSYYYSNGILRIPWETYLLLILWVWMGWLAWRQRLSA